MKKKVVAKAKAEALEMDWGDDFLRGWRAKFVVQRVIKAGAEPYCDAAGSLRLGLPPAKDDKGVPHQDAAAAHAASKTGHDDGMTGGVIRCHHRRHPLKHCPARSYEVDDSDDGNDGDFFVSGLAAC